MSKKSRRQRKLNLPPEAFNTPVAAPVAQPAIGKPSTASTPAQRNGAVAVDWKAEYGDVLGDLKRTAILAGIIMVAMVALSFVIH